MFNVPSFFGFRSNGFASPIDPDYQAVLDYATLQGYTLPSASQQSLQNQLVLDLKSAGYWGKFDSFAMYATDGDSDYALIDWKRLINMTAINSPAFTTNKGFEGNFTSAYIETNYIPSIDAIQYTQNNAGYSIYIWKTGSDGRYVVATNSGSSPQMRMRVHSNPSQLIDSQINSAVDTQVQGFNSNAIGHFHQDRDNSSNFRNQFNSTLSNQYNAGSGGVPNLNIWVFRITTQYANQGISYFIARSSMTQAEKISMNAIISNYLNAI